MSSKHIYRTSELYQTLETEIGFYFSSTESLHWGKLNALCLLAVSGVMHKAWLCSLEGCYFCSGC